MKKETLLAAYQVVANDLDQRGMLKTADKVDEVLKRISRVEPPATAAPDHCTAEIPEGDRSH